MLYLFERRIQWLGYLGVAPLAASAAWVALDAGNGVALDILRNYAAVILTFLGAIHWGRAMYNQNSRLVTLSVLPSLFAFACLLLSMVLALPLLAAGFALMMILDSYQYDHLPRFKQLRFHLTFSVVTLLLITWFVVLLRAV